MRVMREEVFGPVVCLYPVPDAEAALRVANDSPVQPDGQRLEPRPAPGLARWPGACAPGRCMINEHLAPALAAGKPLGRHGRPERLRAHGRAARACWV